MAPECFDILYLHTHALVGQRFWHSATIAKQDGCLCSCQRGREAWWLSPQTHPRDWVRSLLSSWSAVTPPNWAGRALEMMLCIPSVPTSPWVSYSQKLCSCCWGGVCGF